MTINEGLSLMKSLKLRHQELNGLRELNKGRIRHFLSRGEKDYIEEPTYDVRAVDKKAMAVKLRRGGNTRMKVKRSLTDMQAPGQQPWHVFRKIGNMGLRNSKVRER